MSGSSVKRELHCGENSRFVGTQEGSVAARIEGDHSNEKNAADGVAPVWCCISGAYTEKIKGDGGCDLLYYVVGSILHRKLTNKESFDSIMKEVHEILEPFLSKMNCKDLPSNNGKKLFELMEKLSYYNLDPRNVWKEKGGSKEVSCGGCANYLEELAEALREVDEYCKDTLNKDECEGIERGENHQGNPGYVAQLIDDFIPKPEGAAITEDGMQGKCSIKLPSELEHGEFGHLRNQCEGGNGYSPGLMKEMLRKILDGYRSPWNSANQIIRGACYAHRTEGGMETDDNRCIPLYYYIGSVISTVPSSVYEFASLMKATYNKLKNLNVGINEVCTNIYEHDNIDKTTFDNMKLIYDYTRDYKIIKQYAQIPEGGESSCIKHYSSYLEKVISAYKNMSAKCPPEGEDKKININKQWCRNFKDMAQKHSLQELQELRCSLNPTSECPTTNSTAAITGSAVGGTLFTLGLPLAAFLSYKYDLLPSGVRKFFFSGRNGTRMRRTAFGPNSDAEMENFTEYYTENNSTTIDPTEYSTVAGSSSNLTTTSTEDSSTLYDEDGPSRSPPLPRKKRGGGNNRRGQNISYHSMER
ncbi:KIR protein [Plasmodium knowlesi strain H]|uniref:KIR protein n=3 Tax=Plasmodium knowlesi TaxID=5850 RepID=A0A193QWM7_PLAKH|nr:KIR protein [Plasmodium knowlesi]SBO26945.1 KIR protein [Plasmodium knowlesi strain H]SBO29601.1 KIR protein [Plasmodium knowlesi strain H]